MSHPLPGLLAILFVAGSLAGCAGQPSSAPQSSESEPPPLVPRDADYGAIEGFVTGLDQFPLANATVQLVGTNQSRVTDATGYYVFIPLAPGDYQISANLSGHLAVARKILVPAGDSLRIDFLLREIPNPKPYIDASYSRRGQIQCTVRANASGTNTNPSCSDQAPEQTGGYLPPSQGANVTLLPGVGGIVVEVSWTGSVPVLNDKLRLAIRPINGGPAWRQIEGRSVLRVVMGPADLGGLEAFSERNFTTEGGALFFNLYPGEAVAQPGAGGAGGTFQQDYTIYVTVFYRQGPDATYTRIQ